jgi:Pre ATP-grasp domain/PGM1 C-terminal domain
MRIIVGNALSDEYGFGEQPSPEARLSERSGSFQALWSAHDGDVVVLPVPPDEELLGYITGLTGVDPHALTFMIPPTRPGDEYTLTRERLLDPRFLSRMRECVGDREVHEIFAIPDSSIARFARELDIPDALPGCALFEQRGASLVNSKAVFRAIAAGAGIPVPEGGVFTELGLAAEMAAAFVGLGRNVIMKKDLGAGGAGNVVLTGDSLLRPVGAKRAVTVSNQDDVESFFGSNWSWLTGGGVRPLVVEEYFDGSIAVFAELLIAEESIRLQSCGEIVSEPMVTAQMMPPPRLADPLRAGLTTSAYRLCEILSAMGYRGIVGADAIVTPDNQLFFTECNARPTGSTLIYDEIGNGVVGNDCHEPRLLLERRYWYVDSLKHALTRLRDAGVAYDKRKRKGILLSRGYDEYKGLVRFCVVGESWEEIRQFEEALLVVDEGPGRVRVQ